MKVSDGRRCKAAIGFRRAAFSILMAVASTYADYFPLEVGNWWQYDNRGNTHGGLKYTKMRISILSETDSAGIRIYNAQRMMIYGGPQPSKGPTDPTIYRWDTTYRDIRYLRIEDEIFTDNTHYMGDFTDGFSRIGKVDYPPGVSFISRACYMACPDTADLGSVVAYREDVGLGMDSTVVTEYRSHLGSSTEMVYWAPGMGPIRHKWPNSDIDWVLLNTNVRPDWARVLKVEVDKIKPGIRVQDSVISVTVAINYVLPYYVLAVARIMDYEIPLGTRRRCGKFLYTTCFSGNLTLSSLPQGPLELHIMLDDRLGGMAKAPGIWFDWGPSVSILPDGRANPKSDRKVAGVGYAGGSMTILFAGDLETMRVDAAGRMRAMETRR